MLADGQKGGNILKDIEVKVFDNDLEKAMRILKKKVQNALRMTAFLND